MAEPRQKTDLQARVAHTADIADLHAPVPTLLLELQSLLGALSATVTNETERGRRPFRPGRQWSQRLGELAYGVYLLADQTGTSVAEVVEFTAHNLELRGRRARAEDEQGWPFEG
jgi:hypothetical protein